MKDAATFWTPSGRQPATLDLALPVLPCPFGWSAN